MRKWLKSLLLLVAILLVALLGGVLVLWRMVRAQPDFYHVVVLPREQVEAAAQSATNKFATIQNQAARIRAGERAARAVRTSREGASGSLAGVGTSSTQAPTTAPDAISVTFTDTELNAFFEKWSNFQNWKSQYQRYVEDPIVILKDGRIILAGKLKDADLIASLHFEPKITPDGNLDLQLVRVLGGSLPLPQALVSGYEGKITDALRHHLPAWQRGAAFDDSGAANSPLICASLAKHCIRIFDHAPSEPVLFLPIFAQRGSVPVRLTQVKIDDGSLTLTVEPMTREQQGKLIEHVKAEEPEGAEK
jgi:uncharacterized protein YpmS